ncbi:hypothetical protein MWU61_18825 [Loktanella sp. F6476L]|uniref:hypothetical protein n=1 Tax=Loktanella sp. F6476L TaxID=2926405 RepID=UPI001FF2159A|nr:hypothetical protein [Loktanella sp. F6476L]MCK0122612.1 hypothetical protein [Loktanella sp. F6476L]
MKARFSDEQIIAMIKEQEWTCRAFVPPQVLVYAAFRSKATGLFQPSAECRRRGL